MPILLPTRNLHRIHKEAKGRVVTMALGQGHMVIPVQGQGHPHAEDAIHGPGLQYAEASLPRQKYIHMSAPNQALVLLCKKERAKQV